MKSYSALIIYMYLISSLSHPRFQTSPLHSNTLRRNTLNGISNMAGYKNALFAQTGTCAIYMYDWQAFSCFLQPAQGEANTCKFTC